MNILKLAKHLKEFTLEEINMIAECNCKQELQELLKTNKISFDNGVYKFVEENNTQVYGVFTKQNMGNKVIDFKTAIQYFLDNYVKANCKYSTYRQYRAFLRYHIYPFFKDKAINEITNLDIQNFYYFCKKRKFSPKVLKNILTLLNQLIRYFEDIGIIESSCKFQVKRLTSKNEFSLNRIVFEEY